MSNRKRFRIKIFSIIATILMVLSLITPALASTSSNMILNDTKNAESKKLPTRLVKEFDEDDKVTFLVKFNNKANLKKVVKESKENANKANLSSYKAKSVQRSAIITELKATTFQEQQSVVDYLEIESKKGNVDNFHSYFVVNGMTVTATKEVAERIVGFPEVEKILPDETRQLIATKKEDEIASQSNDKEIEWNVQRVGAPDVWDMGIDGTGIVIASIDSGTQWDHPALKESYRGYDKETDTVDHDYNWFDATAGKDTPYDDIDHGTHVTGTMVGVEPDGTNQIGVAPGAEWISVKAFTRSGGRDSDLLSAAEWIMAPTDSEGNVDIDKIPDIVNNSWGGGPGLNEWYRDVVKAWRSMGIFPEFSAGNITIENPGGPGSVAAPANYPESFATGSIDIDNKVASSSLRGPSPYGEIKPDIAAPGVDIRSAVPGSAYEGGWSGTSMAGPAVSATIALLLQANSSLEVDEIEEILMNTATPLTDDEYHETPNHGYGAGLVDAYRAVLSITEGLGRVEGKVLGNEDNTPLRAEVSIVDEDRSVKTDPETGAYQMLYGIGEFTLKAEAYGHKEQSKTVTIAKDETATINFELEENPKGTISGVVTNKSTGRVLENTMLYLVEDANTDRVKTDEDGQYQLEGYEDSYTMKVVAHNHHVKEIPVTIKEGNLEINVELEPYYTYPGEEIGYDDGSAETATALYFSGGGYGVKMSLPKDKDSAIITGGMFKFWDESFPNPGDTPFAVEVWDSTGEDGMPGNKIAGPIDGKAVRDADKWTEVDLWEEEIVVTDDFYMVYIQTGDVPYVPGLGLDRNGAYSQRNYTYVDGEWKQTFSDTGNYMIRARLSYEVDEPNITTPKEDFITNESVLDVSGIASPTTAIQLLNNEELVSESSIESDGNFTFTTELEEGDNNIKAVSSYKGDVFGESNPIIVTLDTIKPKLTINSHEDGDITNKDVVRIEGLATDNVELDTVTVNDQHTKVVNDAYSQRVVLEQGSNKVEVIATDKAGNTETKMITVKKDSTVPEISNLHPSNDLYVTPGEKVKVSFDSETTGGEASFEVKVPTRNNTQSTFSHKMEEVERGHYQGEWTVPVNTELQDVTITVQLTDEIGNKASKKTAGKLYISPDRIDRISGKTRFQTAVEVSQQGWESAEKVILARSDEYADALAGVPLAYQLNAPILLTRSNKLIDVTLEEINRLEAEEVIILGGTGAISKEVEAGLKSSGIDVDRIAGDTRFDTAANIAERMAPEGTGKAVVVNGRDFPDALSVASQAAQHRLPILLTREDELPQSTEDALTSLGVSETVVVGGTVAINDSVLKELPDSTRVRGSDRIATNIAIQKHFNVEHQHMYVATGDDYVDALTGAVLAANNNSSVLLVRKTVSEILAEYIKSNSIKRLTLFGGTTAISEDTQDILEKLLK